MSATATPAPIKSWPILLGAALLLSLAMGLRQSLGLFMLPMTQGIGATVADFTLSIAIQNAVWGLTQPAVGVLADRYGFRPVAITGALLYIAGLACAAFATGPLALIMIPAAILMGRADRIPKPPRAGEAGSTAEVIHAALRRPAFLVMSAAYFVCGLQLVFLTTHLPTYLAICGMDPMLSAEAIATIGVANVIGSYGWGWLGGHFPKHILLGLIYTLRSLALAAYFLFPPTPPPPPSFSPPSWACSGSASRR